MDTPTGIGFSPTEYVDITRFMDQKREIIRCHASQLEWVKEHDGMDLLWAAEVMAEFRGMQCGVEYAEGFRRHLHLGMSAEDHDLLREVLASRVTTNHAYLKTLG